MNVKTEKPVAAVASPRQGRLLVILGIALIVRLGAACSLQILLEQRWHRDFLISGDAEGYWMLAQRIAAGENYAIYTPPRYVLRMPGFPALLSIPVALFGPRLFAARLMLAGLGTFTCWQVYCLGKQACNERIGLWGAGLAAASPVFIGFSVLMLSETAFAATLLLSLCAGQSCYRVINHSNARSGSLFCQAVLTGVAIAAGVLMRPSWILAGPIVAVLLILTSIYRRKAVIAGVLIVVSMILVLLPWGMRNQRVTGHFTLTTFWMGPSLYDGLNPAATGDSDMRFFDDDALMSRMSEYDVDQYYREKAWKFARKNPGRVIELAIAKAARYWSPWPNADQFSQPAAKVVVSLFFLPMLGLAIYGGVLVLKCSVPLAGCFEGCPLRERIWSLAIFAGPICYFALIHMVFVSSLRYRLPAEYPLLVLSAAGIEHFLKGRTGPPA